MNRLRGLLLIICCLTILTGVGASLFGDGVVAAAENETSQLQLSATQEEAPPPELTPERLEVYARYPLVKNTTNSVLAFDIYMRYEGSQKKIIDLELEAPTGWAGQFRGGYPETVISAFTLQPGKRSDTIRLIISPISRTPEAGEYLFTVRAVSDTVTATAEMKAVLVEPLPRYFLYLTTSTLRREFQIKPNQGSNISFDLTNYQTGLIKDIVLTAEVPDGWKATFTPGITSLEPGATQEIDLIITPASNAEAGDYPVRVRAAGDKAESEYNIRVTLTARRAADAAGIGIAAALVAGLIVWFRRTEGAKSGAKNRR